MKRYIIPFVFIGLIACSEDTPKLNPKTGEVVSNLASGQESEDELMRTVEERRQKEKEREAQRLATETTMEADVDEHDFGIIPKETPVSKVFKIKNTGNNPLIISDAKASCGCTVPKRPQEPIAPGDTGELEVTFTSNPGQEGTRINKTITVSANIPGGMKLLTIKGEVTK
jgi:hypothetical protein